MRVIKERKREERCFHREEEGRGVDKEETEVKGGGDVFITKLF